MLSVLSQHGFSQFLTMPLNYPHDGTFYSPNIVSIIDASHVWVASQRQNPSTFYMMPYSQALKTTDGGITWQFFPLPVTGNPFIVDVQAWDANTCYYLLTDLNTGGGSVWKTTDGGSTWTKKTTTQFNGGFADFIHLFSQNNCLALGDPVGGYFDIQISQDGGDTWSRVPQANIPAKLTNESGIGGKSFSAIGNTIWFASSAGRCFKSVDGGNNWTVVMVEPGAAFAVWQVCFTDLLHGVFYKRNAIPAVYYKTSDGGATWTSFSMVPEKWMPGISRVDGIYGGYILSAQDTTGWLPTSVYYTHDFFSTVTKIDSGLHSNAFIYFKDANTGWLSGAFHPDTNIYKFNGVLTSVNATQALSEKLTIIPNPSSQNALITFPGVFFGHKKNMRISDISGKIIREYKLDTDDNSMNLKASSYPNGVYNIELISDDGLSVNNRWIIYH